MKFLDSEDLAINLRFRSLLMGGTPLDEIYMLCDKEKYPADLYDEVVNLYLAFHTKDMQE